MCRLTIFSGSSLGLQSRVFQSRDGAYMRRLVANSPKLSLKFINLKLKRNRSLLLILKVGMYAHVVKFGFEKQAQPFLRWRRACPT